MDAYGPLDSLALWPLWLSWGMGLLGTAFWIWMAVDCARNDPDRGFWLWIIIIASVPGALVYFAVRKAPALDFPLPSCMRRWARGSELERLEADCRSIGNAHQHVQLGDLCLELGLAARASEAFAAALGKEPQSLPARWGAAQAALALGRPDEAVPHAAAVFLDKPDYKYGEAYLVLARALLAAGRRDEALAHLEKHLDRWTYAEAYVLLAELRIERGDTAAARQVLLRVIDELRGEPEFSHRRNARWIRRANRLLRRIGRS